MVRLTDRPDMTLDVYRGRKTTIQQQYNIDYRETRFEFQFASVSITFGYRRMYLRRTRGK